MPASAADQRTFVGWPSGLVDYFFRIIGRDNITNSRNRNHSSIRRQWLESNPLIHFRVRIASGGTALLILARPTTPKLISFHLRVGRPFCQSVGTEESSHESG